MVLAFRLYGDFHWPPRPDIEDLATKTIKGVVEIHFREKDAPGIFRPILRWTPRDKYLPDTPLPYIHPNLFDFKVKEAVAWFDANETNDCAIWIDAGAYTADTDWVAFRGAFLLEQHRASNALEKEALDLRWPLVRSCRYVPGKTVLSGLDVGRRGGPRFCLNLHLPLPARRATLLSGSQTDPSAFPFTAVYEPGNGAFDKILQFTTLVGGWIEGDAVDTSPAPVSNTSFVFAGNKYPDDASLGTFGFSARGKPAQGSFAVYGGTQKYKAIDAKTFWPDNSRPFTQDMLGRYGFTIDPKSAEWPRLKAGDTTADLSLRFATNESDARKPAFIYRIAVSASGDDPKAADDIKKGINGLSLRLREETGGWLNTAENLYVDCKLSWDISDRDIWNTDERRWSAKVELSLHWKNDIPTGDNFGSSPANGADLDIGLLRHTAHSFGEARNALKSVEGGQARSALPDLKADGKQSIRLALSGPMLDAGFLTDGIKDQPHSGLLTWGRPAASGAKGAFFVRPRLRLTLADLRNLIQNSDDTAGFTDNSLKLIASNQTFFNDSAAPSRLNLRLSRDDDWSDTQSEAMADGEPFFASYVLEVMPPADARSGRLSSLRFDMAPGAGPLPTRPDDLTRTYLRAGGPGIRSGMGNGAPPISVPDGRIAASIHMVLAVNDVTPIGVDVSRMDRSGRPTPLLIRSEETDPADGVAGYRYWLSIRESIAPTADRLLEADIYETAPETGAQSYVVLSEEPFSLFRYSHKPLGDRGDAGSASVATYSSDDRIWQYRKAADLYHYILPPQAVGESADKPRRLEIHDLATTVEDGTPDAIRPFVTGKEDDLKRRAVEFRLTPSTEFWIRPSDVERGYFMPESASHEIFRQRGEYGMGAALSYLRGEFLYGLSVGIDVSRETSIARQARVAEIEALTGRITGPARDADAEPRLKARWNALSRAVARRPERLEVWARDPDSAIDFTPARFADGVSFTLRGTALHRPPLARLEAPGDQDAWPKIGGFKPNLADRSDPQRLDRSKPRTHPQGLSGGALWPVESSNLFNELLRRPESTSGAIESIALSPTGGDATQKAAFLGGIVTVISETRNGHVERQKVEVLGRIGAFWHRAKHVVVYERTVNPSAQFAPRHVEDPARTRSRRPILRKVREYIELLEPERRYPDFSAAAPRCAGFLERVRFNSKIINVDSAWSTEIGDYGWKIPLWNLMSARERPQVYPMPDIAFVTTAEGDGNNPVVSQECIDTDNLFFFSEFRTTTSDTNQWLALGLTLPFNQIGDRLIPPDLSNFNIGDIFGNFGGLNLKSLFEGYKMPAGMKDAIRVTHDFDKAQARAWVQVDIDAPMPGRRTLFSLGVFQIDFVDLRMTGQVRLEASKDQDRVTQSGFGRIDTTIDVIAAGQSMVRFEKFALNFTREKGLEIEFDPKNIRLNPSFKFIQDFLSNLFPDEVGGLKIVKQDNIPVGVEHDFVIPPMTLNFGTSGVSNISIENHFKLVAFPDFMIANRFNLSTIERPFIFSIFIIGGTGYIQIDAEYRPFDSQLMVSVEAGAGGSAALAFAVGPFVGQVFITLSGVMTYRKMIGKPGGGLSLAVVVVIAGQVEVCGIVTVGINLVLRLSYRDNGQIDGQGSLSVSIRISRFFTLRARANVNYKLRGGKSETSVTSSVSGEVEKGNLDKRIEQAEQAVKKLQKASN